MSEAAGLPVPARALVEKYAQQPRLATLYTTMNMKAAEGAAIICFFTLITERERHSQPAPYHSRLVERNFLLGFTAPHPPRLGSAVAPFDPLPCNESPLESAHKHHAV